MLERDLHQGVQQQLIALAVGLQLVRALMDTDTAGAKSQLDDLRRDVQQGLDEATRLAQRLSPPLLQRGGLAAALRWAASSVGIRATLDVDARPTFPAEVASTIYWCGLEVFEHAGAGARATVTVRDDEGAAAFEFVASGSRPEAGVEERLRDRVEALGGRLAIRTGPGVDMRVSGSLPLRPDQPLSAR